MDKNNVLIGALLTVIFILCAWWHIRENARLEEDLKKKTDEATAQWLLRFAWSRTFQLLGALAATIIIFISYDKQLTDSRQNLDQLSDIVEKREKLEKQFAAQKKVPLQQAARPAQPPAVKPLPATARPVVITRVDPQPVSKPVISLQTAAPVAAPQQQAEQQSIPPSEGAEPVADTASEQPAAPPQAAVDTAQPQPQPNSNSATIEALYNPEKSQTDSQSAMDDIKKRYEDILVIHFFLKKCGKVQPDDYNTISYALTQEMAAVAAPEKLQNDIIKSAQGSYNEIYAKSSCNANSINSLIDQYQNYIKVLATSFSQAAAPAAPAQ